jgi:hypothetical protein
MWQVIRLLVVVVSAGLAVDALEVEEVVVGGGGL